MTEAVEIGAVTASTARALLRLRGDTASRALAELLVRRYGSLTEDQKIEFFRVLLDEFGADRAAVDAAIGNYQADPTEQTLVTLAEAADSRRLELFRAINTAPGGIAVLLDMRTSKRILNYKDVKLVIVKKRSKWFHAFDNVVGVNDCNIRVHCIDKLRRPAVSRRVKAFLRGMMHSIKQVPLVCI